VIELGTRPYYLARREAELPAFLRVLRALPLDEIAYKPHDRSPSAEQIVWTMTKELASCVMVVTEFRASSIQDPPPSLAEMIDQFEHAAHTITDRVAAMSDADWSRTAQFYHKGALVSEQPVGQFLWFIHFDAIHHRGQLSTYLRPMGGQVPSIYGPSADSRPST
jgi:uncharacterized damage-inducible protein DinB